MATTLKKKATEVVGLDQSILEMDSGLGNKEIDQDTLSIPFLKRTFLSSFLRIFSSSSTSTSSHL